MGAVEVLRPHDPLQKRFSYRETSFVNSAMKSKRNSFSNPNPNPKSGRGFAKSDRRKRSPQKNTGNGGVRFSSSPPPANGGFTMGQVKILKRGEALSNTTSLNEELNKKKIDSVSRLGHELESKEELNKKIAEKSDSLSRLGQHGIKTTPKKFIIADFYAGSACDSSPPPSSLPVPGFFKKKNILVETNDDATCDLRRLLRLDLS